jgi:predicted nuclease with RNAse H fold
VQRPFSRFVGVDLGGGRGKTTAVAELRIAARGGAEVIEVATRAGKLPWTDDTLIGRLAVPDAERVIAIDAPLTQAACGRCVVPVCPGTDACVDPAVVWLRTEGRTLLQKVAADSVAAGGGNAIARALARTTAAPRPTLTAQARLVPYAHRATDVVMTYQRGLLPMSSLGAANSTITARAGHLRKRLRGAGYQLHGNLLEVSPTATIAALAGDRAARGYKRDADPWVTRASVLESFADLTFAPQSRMAREDVLRNDHCFDAVISAYTAYLWARDAWQLPPGVFAEDGWIFVPPET